MSKAQWTRSMPTIPYIKIHSQTIKVLDIKLNLIQDETVIANSGIQSYSFHFALPEDIPSSFKTKVAKVKYCIKIKAKAGKKILKTHRPLIIIGKINLNSIESFLVRIIKAWFTHPFYFSFSYKFGKTFSYLWRSIYYTVSALYLTFPENRKLHNLKTYLPFSDSRWRNSRRNKKKFIVINKCFILFGKDSIFIFRLHILKNFRKK